MAPSLLDLLRRIDNFFDRCLNYIRTRTGWGLRAPIFVIPYRGFGRPDRIRLGGRVLKYKPLYGHNNNSPWKSFSDSLRRFGTQEIGGAQLDIQVGPHLFHVVTDEEGFFLLDQPLEPSLELPPHPHYNWHQGKIHLRRTPWRELDVVTQAEILLPAPEARFGIISDIDDTILETHVTSILKLKMLYYTLFKNASGRQPFREVAAFFQALMRFPGEHAQNPFFYVSNSPWNLYDLLLEFFSLNHLPKGPILLRDIGIPQERPIPGERGHKFLTITRILTMYPDLPFLLVGDSAELDADIYLEIARQFPDRIRAIYIRDVRSRRRAERIASLIRSVTNVPIQLIHHYRDAAADAASRGLLLPEEFEKWRERLEKS